MYRVFKLRIHELFYLRTESIKTRLYYILPYIEETWPLHLDPIRDAKHSNFNVWVNTC